MGEFVINPKHNVFKQYRKVNLVNPYWFSKPFESTWRTSNISTGSSTSTQVKLPLISTGTYNFVVSWGDGSSSNITAWNQAQVTHTYSVAGDYTIKITGTCIGWQFNNTGDRLKILSIITWGKLRLGTNQGNYFYGCSNLNLTGVTDILELTGTINLTSCFRGCTTLTTIGRLNEWVLTNVTNISAMFLGCTSFNQNIGNWDIGNVTTLTNTFLTATVFNNGGSSSIGNWNTANVTVCVSTFQSSAFNQDIGNWNMSKVTNMSSMFSFSSFRNANSSSINNWNTGLVQNMSTMFISCPFNQNIGNWNVSNVTNFASMFEGSSFNNGGSTDINNWVLKSTGSILMNQMFKANTSHPFNQPIGNWNMSRVTTTSQMFSNASSFNQNISSWNTGLVTDMSAMFYNATAFNQNIGAWNISNVTNFTNFMSLKTNLNYSAANLDAIYNGWSSLVGGVKPSIVITFGTIKYTVAGSAGKAILTGAPNLWSITDGGI